MSMYSQMYPDAPMGQTTPQQKAAIVRHELKIRELQRKAREEWVDPLPCPFCGKKPRLLPIDPARDGNAWGAVACHNSQCKVQPRAEDYEIVADDRGTRAYQYIAVSHWNAYRLRSAARTQGEQNGS